MSDISAFQSGDFDNSGKVNWRGDQVNIPNAQSIYKTSSVQLAELGMRLVVGDRVFRYALAAGAVNAGNWCENQQVLAESLFVNAGTFVSPTSNAQAATAGNKTISIVAATTYAANLLAESNLIVQSGTAANTGQVFRIKSHPVAISGATLVLSLYDEINHVIQTADTWTIQMNQYNAIKQGTTGATTVAVGVAPLIVASGDYFWMQTWGPAAVKNAVATRGVSVVADVTGQVIISVSATTAGANAQILGYAMQTMTASQYGGVFLTINP